MWDCGDASEILSHISYILETARYPLDLENYANRILNIAILTCRVADKWENIDKKLDRTLIGVGFLKSNFEALIEKNQENRTFPRQH
jgi:hypothetical protein